MASSISNYILKSEYVAYSYGYVLASPYCNVLGFRVTSMVLSWLFCFYLKASQVSVGWGKKETQFHGSEGKEAAKQVKQVIK